MLTYELPRELIAQRPVEPRDACRLLVLHRATGKISHQIFRDLPQFLRPGDCLVLNDTKVLPARIFGRKAQTGGKVELLLLEKKGQGIFQCLGKPGLRPGAKILLDHGSIEGEVLFATGQERVVRFSSPSTSSGRTLEKVLFQLGEIPLPPYIDRPVEPDDAHWYQTVFAREPGAVAAPTAGLHFTPELLDRIRDQGVEVAFVTLHVGWGTFKPVTEEELASGRLHAEQFSIPDETAAVIRSTKEKGGRVIAVGTTVVRALEASVATGDAGGEFSAASPAAKRGRTAEESAGGRTRGPRPVSREGTTNLFIRPPYAFKVVDGLVTNFHLPGTSLLLLVSAFAGEKQILEAYDEAIRQRYRFYSYGDAMVIL